MNAMLQGVSRKNIEDKLDEVEGFAELKGFLINPFALTPQACAPD